MSQLQDLPDFLVEFVHAAWHSKTFLEDLLHCKYQFSFFLLAKIYVSPFAHSQKFANFEMAVI